MFFRAKFLHIKDKQSRLCKKNFKNWENEPFAPKSNKSSLQWLTTFQL